MTPARPLIVLAIALAPLLGCERDPAPPPPNTAPAEPPAEAELLVDEASFFDGELLLEGAVDLAAEEDVPCAGASEQEAANPYHPRVIRGEIEWPADDLEVSLYPVDGHANPTAPALQTTRASATGRFCLRVPDDATFGPGLLVEARGPTDSGTDGDTVRLRRLVLQAEGIVLDPRSEALVRLLVDERIDLSKVPLPTLFNLDILAQTAVDLLNPVELGPDDTLATAVARLGTALRDDARTAALVGRMKP